MLDKVFLQVLNMSFTASVVILFVLMARLLLRKTPKALSYTLWGVVLFRLVCPFSFESVFSLLPAEANPISQHIAYRAVPTIDTGIPAINHAMNSSLPAATPAASISPVQVWVFMGTMVWIVGIAVLLSYSIFSLVKLQTRLKDAVCERDNIYLAEHLETPFVMGIIRPKIYLPASLTDEEKGYILLHEEMHIKRLDHVIKVASFLVLCLHWFNPFVWIAFFVSGKDMEMSCDEAVIKQLGCGIKKEYSASLLTLATGRRIIGGTPLAFGEGDTKARIKNVLHYKRPGFWMVAVSVVAVICLIMGLMSNPKDNPAGFASVNAIILEIDKNTQTMTVQGVDENSVIGDKCIVTWQKDALMTLATSSQPMQLSIDDFSVGDSVVLFIGEVQEAYPTRVTASSIQLQPSGASQPSDLRPMVMIDGTLYLETGKESPVAATNEAGGTIKTYVSQHKKPTEHEQSNFGFVGSQYVMGQNYIQVNIDGKWIVFEAEIPFIGDSSNAAPAQQSELTFFVKPDEPPQVIGNTAAAIWLKSYIEESTPLVERIANYEIHEVTAIAGTPKAGQNREDMKYHYVVRINYDITTTSDEYLSSGDGVSGKGTFKNLFRELCVKDLGGGNFHILSAGTGGGESEFAQLP